MFKKILIANRAEIACRIIRTCKELGISTVAVFSDSDMDSPAVKMADESVYLGASAAAESYLSQQKIIQAALTTGADALHPVVQRVRRHDRRPADAAVAPFSHRPAQRRHLWRLPSRDERQRGGRQGQELL